MRGSIKLGKIAGIGVFIHWTFALLLLYIVVSNYREGQDALQILWAVIFILSIFVTVFLHELGHALAAKHYHINTRDITLYPSEESPGWKVFPKNHLKNWWWHSQDQRSISAWH